MCVVYRHEADAGVRRGLEQSLYLSYTSNNFRNPVTITWDAVMSNMECCGVNNYTDFLHASKFVAAAREEGLGRRVPESCCVLQGDKSLLLPTDETCIASPTTANSYFIQVTKLSVLYRVSQKRFNLNFESLECFLGVILSYCI